MFIGFVNTSDIVDVNPTVTVSIKFFESLSNDLLSCHVHWSSDSSDELIIGDGTGAINIEVLEEGSVFGCGETEFVIGKSFIELWFIK